MVFPPISWAERDQKIFLTVQVQDLQDVDVKFEEKAVHFSAKKGETEYQVDIPLKDEIVPDLCITDVKPHSVIIFLEKKEKGWWYKLVEGRNPGWLKVDWDRWADEDDEKAATMPYDLPEMPGMPGMPGGFNFDEEDDYEDEDAEEEEEHHGCCCGHHHHHEEGDDEHAECDCHGAEAGAEDAAAAHATEEHPCGREDCPCGDKCTCEPGSCHCGKEGCCCGEKHE